MGEVRLDERPGVLAGARAGVDARSATKGDATRRANVEGVEMRRTGEIDSTECACCASREQSMSSDSWVPLFMAAFIAPSKEDRDVSII